MNQGSPWIASFVQETLSEYLSQANHIQVEDDGASLRFDSLDRFFPAHVQEWGVGLSGHGAVLQDTEYQIDAVIPEELLSLNHPDSTPDQPKLSNPKQYSISLLEFKLVFTYTTTPAQVHLLISKFHINWEQGKSKNFQLKKKLVKNSNVRSLLESTQKHVQTASKAVKANKPRSHAVVRFESTQDDIENRPFGDSGSQQISSQAPHNNSALKQVSQTSPGRLHETYELLRRLESPSSPKSRNNTSFEKNERLVSGQHGLAKVPVNGTEASENTRQLAADATSQTRDGVARGSRAKLSDKNVTEGSDSDEEGSVSSQPNNGAKWSSKSPEPRRSPSQDQKQATDLDGVQSPSKKRPRDGTENLSQPANIGGNSVDLGDDIPPKKRQRTSSTPEVSSGVSKSEKLATKSSAVNTQEAVTMISTPISSRKAMPAQVNPWEGFNGIKERDVTVPKDQQELLDDNKLCWIPPRPNDPLPQGHVPPSLLRVWNNAVKKRHCDTEPRIATPERPVTPSQESDARSIASTSSQGLSGWDSASPERSPPARRHYLPPSSPVAQLTPARKQPKPARINKNHSIQIADNEATINDNTNSQTTSVNLVPETSKTLDPAPKQDQHKSPNKRYRRASPLHEIEMNNQLSQNPGIPASNQESGRISPAPSISPQSSPQAHQDESDEESVMDTSVPFALGESIPEPTQSSHVEEELPSSGPSLPGVNGECIQVAVSPLVDNSQLHRDTSKNSNELGNANASRFSSQAHKTSSQSCILNTYPVHECHDEAESSRETLNPDEHSQDMPIPVNVPVTQAQASSIASQPQTQLQDFTNNSQSDIVLDSSGPAQRHQDMSLADIQPPFIQLTSSHESPQSQLNSQTKPSASGAYSPDNPRSSLKIFPIQPVETSVITQGRYLSRASGVVPGEDGTNDEHPNTQGALLLARRERFINNANKQAEAREVFKQFSSCYDSYSGEFEHFTEMCKKLSVVRQQGKLQRSFLWDDFIIMNRQKYPEYRENSFAQNSKPLDYEDYFLENFSRPCFKKRNLTLQGVELVASQSNSNEELRQITNTTSYPASSPAHGVTSGDSMGSLVANFTDLHAQSFPVLSQGSSRAGSPPMKFEGEEPGAEFRPTQMPLANAHNEWLIASTREPKTEQQTQSDTQNSTAPLETEVIELDLDMDEIPETEPEETEPEDADQHEDTVHETGSVELGDEPLDSPTRAQSPAEDALLEDMSHQAIAAEESEPESENENWFLSLRHMRPRRIEDPFEFPNGLTPFKRWAEADQNVLTERLRRGGAKILLDDQGVIRRPIHR